MYFIFGAVMRSKSKAWISSGVIVVVFDMGGCGILSVTERVGGGQGLTCTVLNSVADTSC